MKDLEKKIISNVYRIETKKTFLTFIITGILLGSLLFLTILFSQIFIEIINEQQTGNILVIFTEGWDIFIRQFNDFLNVIIFEIPYGVTGIIFFSLFLFMCIMLNVIKNFEKIKNKISSLVRYWQKRGY